MANIGPPRRTGGRQILALQVGFGVLLLLIILLQLSHRSFVLSHRSQSKQLELAQQQPGKGSAEAVGRWAYVLYATTPQVRGG